MAAYFKYERPLFSSLSKVITVFFLMLLFFVQSFSFTTGETKAVKPKELDK
jgi:hypothetical protein